MDAIKSITEIDLIEWAIIGFMILSACIAGYKIITEFLAILGKPIGAVKQRKADHELLIKTSQNLIALQEKHEKDDNELKKCLSSFIEESRKESEELHSVIKKIDEDNRNHWGTSKEMRNEIDCKFKTFVEANLIKDKQIDSLILAQKEILAEKINEKYKYYLSIKGIPEDEYDEFVSLHKAYNGVGGNHHGDAKFKYCIEHLRIIPVETKLVYKDK